MSNKTLSKATAAQRLESSRLRPDNLHGFGDIDVGNLVLKVRKVSGIKIREQISDAILERTIDGASTLTITLIDDNREILNSGKLRKKTDLEIDGLWFRLKQIKKRGAMLDLVFEDREIAFLRDHAKVRTAQRSKVTRAEFVLSLIKEVKQVKIRTVIPELHKVQPIQKATDQAYVGTQDTSGGTPGFPPNAARSTFDPHRKQAPGGNVGLGLTVKGKAMTRSQLRNASAILATGISMNARRKVLVASIMTAIQESTMNNYSGGDRDSVGLFQQRASWGSFNDRHDPATAARLFFVRAIRLDQQQPGLAYTELCQGVQRSAYPSAYAAWREEAERIVAGYGAPGGDFTGSAAGANSSQPAGATSSPFLFYRGVPPQQGKTPWARENSWTCIQRLAQEVNWRAFFVAGTFYFLDEDLLIKSRPIMSITEGSTGIDDIDGDYDENKKQADVTVTAQLKRWKAPPGSVIQLFKMGPFNGRWLVHSISRSLFDTAAEINLKKKSPSLPEPLENDINQQSGWGGTSTDPDADSDIERYKYGSALVQPIPAKFNKGHGAVHDTAGLSGYPAIDFFAEPGSPVVAPEAGTIERFSGHDPNQGALSGAGGPLGWTIYLKGKHSGTSYFITHLGKRLVHVGQQVDEAQVIATVADYDKYGRASHAHVGVHGGNITIGMLGSAQKAVK